MTFSEIMDCAFECLTNCPIPDGSCLYDDPLMGWFDRVEYPEFFWWRYNNLPEHLRPVEITPDSMDEFYKEPEGNPYRCPRCLSPNVHFGDVWITCGHCGYNEPLVDFPENVGQIEEANQ